MPNTDREQEVLNSINIPNRTFIYYNGEVIKGTLKKLYDEEEFYIVPNIPDESIEWSKERIKQSGRLIPDIQMLSLLQKDLSPTAKAFWKTDEYKFKKAVIVGAGASFDFTDYPINTEVKPPVTNDLFKFDYLGLLNEYPGVREMVNSMRLAQNLELFFQDHWSKLTRRHDPVLLQRLISIQYYLHHFFLELSLRYAEFSNSHYETLVNHAHEFIKSNKKNECVLFISYNYDTLLELALMSQLRMKLNDLSDYVDFANNRIALIKPHGSANWTRQLPLQWTNLPGPNSPWPIHRIPKELANSNIDFGDIANWQQREINIYDPRSSESATFNYRKDHASDKLLAKSLYVPQLLIPYKDKDEFVLPRPHVLLLEHALTHVEDILIVGWKGDERKMQEIFRNSIGERKVRITNVCSPASEARANYPTMNTLAPVLPNAEWIQKPIGFSGYARELVNSEEHFFSD